MFVVLVFFIPFLFFSFLFVCFGDLSIVTSALTDKKNKVKQTSNLNKIAFI